jgi:serine/threonine-protein kinase RsbW
MRSDTEHKVTIELPSTRDCIAEVTERVSGLFDSRHLPEETVFDMKLAVQEAVANAIEHGNDCDPDKTVRVECEVTDDALVVRVRDEGPGFDPASVPDPTLPQNILRENGRGIFLMQNLCDEVRYNERGNEVTIVKKLPG